MLRPPLPSETPVLVAMGAATGLFKPGEAEGLLGWVLEEFHANRLGDWHAVRVWADEERIPEGWAYLAPTPKADGVWDLWWIGVDPPRQGRGVGGRLLAAVEGHVRTAGGRVLVIETSSTPLLDPTRRFYANRGYAECGRVPDFYTDGDHKVIFAKRL